jgi:glutaredoxin
MIRELGADEKTRIRRWGRGRAGDITLRYATTGHAMDEPFQAFVEQMAELVPRVRLKKDGDAKVVLPTLFIGRQVVYQALPLERELEPFLAALGDGAALADRIAKDVRERLALLRIPALVKVYVTPGCPFCPATVSVLAGLAACSDQVRLTVIDGELFPGTAQKDRINAVPTVILDDQFRWTGSIDAAEVVRLILERDASGLGADALRGMIEDGNAEGVARMMSERGMIFPAFIELLTHQRWSVRLGAMVAFENLAESDPGLAGEVVNPIVEVFKQVDDTVKGDLVHVLGESANRAALPFLLSVVAGEHDDEVQAAAEEAIEKLKLAA